MHRTKRPLVLVLVGLPVVTHITQAYLHFQLSAEWRFVGRNPFVSAVSRTFPCLLYIFVLDGAGIATNVKVFITIHCVLSGTDRVIRLLLEKGTLMGVLKTRGHNLQAVR